MQTDKALPPGRLVDWDNMDHFHVRRFGLFHWKVMAVAASDGIERECAGGARFWRRLTAERVRLGMMVVRSQALWQAGAHPQQHSVGPPMPVLAVGDAVARHGPRA